MENFFYIFSTETLECNKPNVILLIAISFHCRRNFAYKEHVCEQPCRYVLRHTAWIIQSWQKLNKHSTLCKIIQYKVMKICSVILNCNMRAEEHTREQGMPERAYKEWYYGWSLDVKKSSCWTGHWIITLKVDDSTSEGISDCGNVSSGEGYYLQYHRTCNINRLGYLQFHLWLPAGARVILVGTTPGRSLMSTQIIVQCLLEVTEKSRLPLVSMWERSINVDLSFRFFFQ